MKKGNLSFGFNAVVSGQKSSVVDAKPMLIANSTKGKFTVTAPVTKFLGVAAGENIMFVNNIDSIEAAIQAGSQDVINAATELGIDLNTTEGVESFVREFTVWAIAKGVTLLNPNGTPKSAKIRMTVEDKKAYIAKNGAAMAEANREALLERLGVEDATEEELIAAITVDDALSDTSTNPVQNKVIVNKFKSIIIDAEISSGAFIVEGPWTIKAIDDFYNDMSLGYKFIYIIINNF